MFNSEVKVAVAMIAAVVTTNVNAGEAVVGQVSASPRALVGTQIVGAQQTPYLQGEAIETNEEQTASISLTSGKAAVTIAPNTSMSVINASEMVFELNSGALDVSAAAGESISFKTSSGVFTVSSVEPLSVITAFENGRFAVVSQTGFVTVESDRDGVVSNLLEGMGYVYKNGGAELVEVQALGGGSRNTVPLWLWITGGVVGGGLIIDQINDDDDDEVVDGPVASPAG